MYMEFPKQVSFTSTYSVEDLDGPPSPGGSVSSSAASLAERTYGSMSHTQPKLVRLNVGGTVFATLSNTLTQGGKRSFFDALLTGRVPALRDETGAYFIDRNPEVFACLLDFLRSGKLYIPAQVNERRLMEEFDFFGVDYPNVRYLDAEQLEYSYLWAVSATNQRGVLFEMQLCLSKMRGAEPVGYLTSKSSKTGLSEVLTNVVFSVTTRVVQFYRPALEEWYHGTVALLRDEDPTGSSSPAALLTAQRSSAQPSSRSSQSRSPHRTVPCRTSLTGHFMCRDETRVASFGSWSGTEMDVAHLSSH